MKAEEDALKTAKDDSKLGVRTWADRADRPSSQDVKDSSREIARS
jgi:hypothetical protein